APIAFLPWQIPQVPYRFLVVRPISKGIVASLLMVVSIRTPEHQSVESPSMEVVPRLISLRSPWRLIVPGDARHHRIAFCSVRPQRNWKHAVRRIRPVIV